MINFYDYHAKILVLDNLIKPEQTALRERLDWCNDQLAAIQTYLEGIDRDLACRCRQESPDVVDWSDCPIRAHRQNYRDFTYITRDHWQHNELLADVLREKGTWAVRLPSGDKLIDRSFSIPLDAIDAWYSLEQAS